MRTISTCRRLVHSHIDSKNSNILHTNTSIVRCVIKKNFFAWRISSVSFVISFVECACRAKLQVERITKSVWLWHLSSSCSVARNPCLPFSQLDYSVASVLAQYLCANIALCYVCMYVVRERTTSLQFV